MDLATVVSGVGIGLITVGICFVGPWRKQYFFGGNRGLWSSVVADEFYCDEDGESSEASIPEKHDIERPAVIATFPLAFCALLISVLCGVFAGFSVSHRLIIYGWAILVIETVILGRQSSQQRRFDVGVVLATSAFMLALTIVFGIFFDLPKSEEFSTPTVHASDWIQTGIALCLAWISASLSHRPTVYYNGKEVDRQFTCTAIQRFTLAWVRPLIDHARTIGRLEYENLPAPDHLTRSQNLNVRFEALKPDQSVWKALIRDHASEFAKQWVISLIESFVTMLPPYCLYAILSLLEQRSSSDSALDNVIWLWVVLLALSKSLHVALESWIMWISFGKLTTRVRSQLSAAIFAKSLRMKTVETDTASTADSAKGKVSGNGGDALPQEEARETDSLLPANPALLEDEPVPTQDKKDASSNATRGVVNLLGVDVQRVSDFCGYNVDLPRGIAKIVISAALLVKLLGWWSTLAGFAVPIVFHPLTTLITKYYYNAELRLMAARDNKAHVVTEALHGIRQIKFSATEDQWQKRILRVRNVELKAQRDIYGWGTFLTFSWIAMPSMIGAAALTIYAVTTGRMVASVAFTALSIFSSLEWTISVIPMTITEMIDARISAKRIQDHLPSPEHPEMPSADHGIELKDASITWPSNEESPKNFALHGLNLQFPINELSVIHGHTGAGKTLLLNAIIGEADVVEGEVLIPRVSTEEVWNHERVSEDNWIVPSARAYVAQIPWIENASVKDAILFGLPYLHDRYIQVLHACALRDDIAMLPDGEDTEIGATGINLSGGQRWRLTLARALYSRAGILVLDDIFSAVDSHVGRHLLRHGLLGPLGQGRTKILVTHHVDLVVDSASYVVRLDGNTAAEIVRKSPKSGIDLPDLPSNINLKSDEIDGSENANGLSVGATNPKKKEAQKFVQEETREYGRVKWSVYMTYIKASGGILYWALTILLFTLAAASLLMRTYWVAIWTEAQSTEDISRLNNKVSTMQAPHQSFAFYLGIYLGISFFAVVLSGVKIIFVLIASLRASRELFETLTRTVLRAPLRWLDTEPVGRILNRFVGDFASIDTRIGGDMTWMLNGLFSLTMIIVAALFVSAWMLIPVAVLSALSVYVLYLYIDAARDVKRLDSSAKSPIFELLNSTLSGLATIRCFDKTEDYLNRMYQATDTYAQATYYVFLASRWMSFRQGVLGAVFTTSIAVGVVCLSSIDASLAGFALSFALDFSSVARQVITRYTAAELDMNSAERVLEYTNLSTEPSTGEDAPAHWPSNGSIDVEGLEVGYARDLPSVLKGLSFSVEAGTRLGIVGRTGSGKSSLTLALFRFLEARKGSIEIDGIDIGKLKLHDLRSRIAIIPQDPVLFSGTLRANLDPFDEYNDTTLIEALGRLGLLRPRKVMTNDENGSTIALHNSNIFARLSSPVTRGGSNLSQGEKQLVCLARAMISQPKILVLDEATSAVDMETDALIRRSIRDEFRNSTLLVVAHRLSTVADFDRILVMTDGRVAEYDRPAVLAKEKGAFFRMLMDSGEREKLKDLLE